MKTKTHVVLEHIVSFGGKRMTRGKMIRRLQQTAVSACNVRRAIRRAKRSWRAFAVIRKNRRLNVCKVERRNTPYG